MDFLKIYSKENKIIFNKNKLFCFIYKYKEGKEITYSINLSENPSKFHSLFEYISNTKEERVKITMSEQHVEYEIDSNNQIERGRISLKVGKKNWMKKSIRINNGENIDMEEFDNKKNIIYKLSDEVFEKLINKIQEDGK